MNYLQRFWTWFLNLFGVYTGRQVHSEVDEALAALAMFLKISGTNVDQGLEDFKAEVDRLANAIDSDRSLIDQLEQQRVAAESHLGKATTAHDWMASANNLMRSVAEKRVDLDV